MNCITTGLLVIISVAYFENGESRSESRRETFVYESSHPANIKCESFNDYYDVLDEIGSGASSTVYRCRERKTRNIFAAKIVRLPPEVNVIREWIREEIDIMKQLNHRNLLRLHDAFDYEDQMVLIMELLNGGDLLDRITTSSDVILPEVEIINYIRQICEGIQHMHEHNIIHFDIKLDNVMRVTNCSTEVKIIDFGSAKKLNFGEVENDGFSTGDSFGVDMWAVGVAAYLLISGQYPFTGKNDTETVKNVEQCRLRFDQRCFHDISQAGKDFIGRLLIKDSERRMTIHESLNHPWLTRSHSSN